MTGTPSPDQHSDIPGQDGIHGRVGRAYVARALGIGVQMGQQFLIVPVFLVYWGADLYGDWLAILSIAGFIALIDLGLREYFGNELLQRWSRGDREGFGRLLNQSLGAYSCLLVAAIPVICGAVFLWDWPSLAGLNEISGPVAGATLLLISVHLLGALPTAVLSAIYRARGRQATGQIVSALMLFALLIAIVIGLSLGLGPSGVAVCHMAVTVIAIIGLVWHLKRCFPDIRIGWAVPRREEVGPALSKAPFFAAYPAAQALTLHGLVVVLSGLATAGASVVAFATMRTLVGLARFVPHSLGHVTGAELGRQFAQGDYDALERLYRFFLRFNGGLFGGLVGFIAVVGPAFLEIWTVGRVPFEAQLFWLLLLANAVSAPGEAAEMLQVYANRPRGLAAAFGVRGVISVAVAVAAVPSYGAAGAAAGLLAGNIACHAIILPLAAARLARFALWKQLAIGYGTTIVAAIVSWAIARLAAELIGLETLIHLIGVGLLWMALSAVPAAYIVFHRAQRKRIVDEIKKRLSI